MNPDDTLPPVPPSPAPTGDSELWPTSGPAKGFRVRLPIAIASLVVVALAGAAGGASLKHSSSTTTQSGAIANRARGNFGGTTGEGATGANGTGRAPGAGGGVFGTVSKVDGNTVTVTEQNGQTATVVVPSTATISKTDSGTIADLKPGTSIVVRGSTANGSTTAQDVTIAPAGSNGAGAFGGFGGFGGGRNRANGTTTTTN